MAPLSANPDQDFSAGYEKTDPDLDDWRAVPPLPLDDLFNDQSYASELADRSTAQ